MKTARRFVILKVCAAALFLVIVFQTSITNRYLHSVKVINTDRILRTNNKIHVYGERPLLVLGILTIEGKAQNRKAQRDTWLAQMAIMRDILPFRIEYKFWFDYPSPESVHENDIYGDVEYLNLTSVGWGKGYGEKMYVWIKYVRSRYPEALLTMRVDDDVFLCVPQVFDVLNTIKSRMLYYGWCWGEGNKVNAKRMVDEMFIVLGQDLVTRISDRHFCGAKRCNGSNELAELEFGSWSVGDWLSVYDDVDFKPDNERILFHDRMWHGDRSAVITPDFCKKYILHHKSYPDFMARLHQYNTRKHWWFI